MTAMTARALCWSCKTPLGLHSSELEQQLKQQVLAEDEARFGPNFPHDPSTFERASLAALERGVCVRWLEQFTTYYDCWNWPTWRVAEQIVKPATGQSRRRYVEMPAIAQAARVGRADIFLSHAWGGTWGDLVAAALNCIDQEETREEGEVPVLRVYIDVFAVRQWPGNDADIVFAGVVKHVTSFILVVSSKELERVAELDFKTLTSTALSDVLSPGERRGIPFLRIWCLAEINSACVQAKPIVIACGSHSLDLRSKTKHVFAWNTALLYHMQFLVSVELAEALYDSDRVRILKDVQDGVGFSEVNRRVRGAIIGGMVTSRSKVIRLASVGTLSPLLQLLQANSAPPTAAAATDTDADDRAAALLQFMSRYGLTSRAQVAAMVAEAACAAAASGYHDLLVLIMDSLASSFAATAATTATAAAATATAAATGRVADQDSESSSHYVSLKDGYNMTLLQHAVRGGQEQMVRFILDSVAREDSADLQGYIDALNSDQWSALAFAAQFGSPGVIQLLIGHGADVNAVLSGGQIALGIGLQNGFSPECVKLLLDSGSKVGHRDGVGYEVLRHALIPGKQPASVRALLEKGADPNACDNWGDTMLQWAIQGGVQASVSELLTYNVDPSSSSSSSSSGSVGDSGAGFPICSCDINMINAKKACTALDRAQECLGSTLDPNMQAIIATLQAKGALALEQQCLLTAGGCGKLLTGMLDYLMRDREMTRDQAGLAGYIAGGRWDWLQSIRRFPSPGDLVCVQAMARAGWVHGGLVRRGPGWPTGCNVDGGDEHPGCVGFIIDVNRECIEKERVRVLWPLSPGQGEAEKRKFFHAAGGSAGYELEFAPYRCGV